MNSIEVLVTVSREAVLASGFSGTDAVFGVGSAGRVVADAFAPPCCVENES